MAQVVVKSGDSLSQLLKNSGNQNWANPSEWAKYTNTPNVIHPGQVFNFPSSQASGPMSYAPNFTPNPTPVPTPMQSSMGAINSAISSLNPFTPTTAYASELHPSGAVSTPSFVAGTPDWVKPLVEAASKKYNIPTALLTSLLKQESGFNPNATSQVGAQGIAQFMPATAKSFGINPLDPTQSIDAAAKYLRNEWDYFGKPELALASYNAGRGAVQQYGGIPPYKETQGYVKNIMAMAGDIHQSANQPILNIQNEVKKQQEQTPKLQPPSPVPTPQMSQAPNQSFNPQTSYSQSMLSTPPTNPFLPKKNLSQLGVALPNVV